MEKKRFAKHNIIGMIYDFDGTLSPNNMQEDTLFKAYKIDKDELWKRSDYLVRKEGYERTLAYLKLFIHDAPFNQRPFTRQQLQELASNIEYYPGVLDFFPRINRFVEELPEAKEWGVTIEHYIISSGMVEILEGATIHQHFKKVYACEYAYDESGPIFPKLVINDTNKTQFLFRINKGKLELSEDINTHMPEEQRRIPFRNMIYLGDSHTDIPSMTVIKKYSGHAIAVFDPKSIVNKNVMNLVEKGRVDHFAPADFREGKLLTRILETTLKKIIHTISYFGSANMSRDWVNKHKKPT